jgi:transcriptional regulator with XRE-family HTH domain
VVLLQWWPWQAPLASAISLQTGSLLPGPFPVLRSALRERGETELPGTSSPTVSRRELGAQLRALRTGRGWTVDQVAERLLISPSKVSRLETGQRGASPRDIRDLCDLYGLGDEERRRLADLAKAGKQHPWWQPLSLPYATYAGLEAEATLIRDFGLGVVPGLLQTPDYARAVLMATFPPRSREEIDNLVEGRIARQQRVLSGDDPPQFQAVVEASVLHRVVGSTAIMRDQLHRLLEASELPNVSVRVVPYGAGALPGAINKFIILSFESLSLPDVVYVEGLTGDLYIERKEDTDAYDAAFRVMEGMAATQDETRGIIESIMGLAADPNGMVPPGGSLGASGGA